MNCCGADLPAQSLYVGLDSSTQGLKLIALKYDETSNQLVIFKEEQINYDRDLPHYKTQGGVHRAADGLTVTAPTLMWIEALDMLLSKLSSTGFPFHRVVAISGSGQQHGSVYWKNQSAGLLSHLSPSKRLTEQMQHAFSTDHSPIWMDSSTTDLCRELEASLGGAAKVADITGSRAYERFTLSQIAKVCFLFLYFTWL